MLRMICDQVIITGASSGLGEAFARRLAGACKQMVLVARREEKLDALAAELRAKHPELEVATAPCDLSDEAQRARLIEAFGSAENAYHSEEGAFRRIEGISRKDAEKLEARGLAKAYEIMNNCKKLGISYVTFDDAAYPKRLKEIYAAPDVLYYKGKIDMLSANAPVAVIGTRKASAYGLKMARRIAYEISKCGGVVVSGLTTGADAAGAEGVLAAGGVCIGVLGTPVEKATGRLAQQVIENGAVISEYPPYTEQDRSFFPGKKPHCSGYFDRCSGG